MRPTDLPFLNWPASVDTVSIRSQNPVELADQSIHAFAVSVPFDPESGNLLVSCKPDHSLLRFLAKPGFIDIYRKDGILHNFVDLIHGRFKPCGHFCLDVANRAYPHRYLEGFR